MRIKIRNYQHRDRLANDLIIHVQDFITGPDVFKLAKGEDITDLLTDRLKQVSEAIATEGFSLMKEAEHE
jgi:hypothetical protein